MQSIHLPSNVPGNVVLGQNGKIVQRIKELTGARLRYLSDDHRLDVIGHPSEVVKAAGLVERTVQNYLCTGQQFARKQNSNILSPELYNAEAVQLVPCSRPVSTLACPVEAYAISPIPSSSSSSSPTRTSPSASQPDASTSISPHRSGRSPRTPLFLPPSETTSCLEQLVDLATTISLQHPAECDGTEIKLYLGKLVVSDVKTSARTLPGASLTEWRHGENARVLFDTALPQDTIRSLDKFLTSHGLAPTQQSKSVSLHLESSIPLIQYNPTYVVQPDGSMRLSKVETHGCKPMTVAFTGLPNRTDVRLRYVASSEHGSDDPVAEELRRRQSEFTLVNNVQVTIPSDLQETLDLTLTSARVKLKRVYVTSAPLPPPSPAPVSSSDPTTFSSSAAVPRTRGRKTVSSSSSPSSSTSPSSPSSDSPSPPASLPPVSLRVSVAAVVDNSGGKRLEVTIGCPEVNAALLALHRQRAEPPGFRSELLALLQSLMAHVDALRAQVEYEP